jgi:vacuolar-type H+-ATPase subunit I/STV1
MSPEADRRLLVNSSARG